jgi:transcriptional regulator with XRE-family HTH domain
MKMSITQTCSRKLKILRESHDYTQEYVAEVLDISQNAYSLLEKGTTKITLDRLEKLAELYKMPPVELINENAISMDHVNGTEAHSNFPPAMSSFEKKMYEQTISRLEIDIEKLYNLLHQLTTNMSNPQPHNKERHSF